METPASTKTWTPVSHFDFVSLVKKKAEALSLEITNECYGLSPNEKKMFGIIDFSESTSDYGWSVGLRNSHDKSMRAGIVSGAKVFVCDNMCFSGDLVLKRKHSKNINLEELVDAAFVEVQHEPSRLFASLDYLKTQMMTHSEICILLMEMASKNIFTGTESLGIYKELYRPSHREFLNEGDDKSSTKFNLLMAFTEKAKYFSLEKYDRLHRNLPAILGY